MICRRLAKRAPATNSIYGRELLASDQPKAERDQHGRCTDPQRRLYYPVAAEVASRWSNIAFRAV
jgi:hypothetical protein